MMAARTRRSRSAALSARLALASLGTAAGIGVVCAVGLSSLENNMIVTEILDAARESAKTGKRVVLKGR